MQESFIRKNCIVHLHYSVCGDYNESFPRNEERSVTRVRLPSYSHDTRRAWRRQWRKEKEKGKVMQVHLSCHLNAQKYRKKENNIFSLKSWQFSIENVFSFQKVYHCISQQCFRDKDLLPLFASARAVKIECHGTQAKNLPHKSECKRMNQISPLTFSAKSLYLKTSKIHI